METVLREWLKWAWSSKVVGPLNVKDTEGHDRLNSCTFVDRGCV